MPWSSLTQYSSHECTRRVCSLLPREVNPKRPNSQTGFWGVQLKLCRMLDLIDHPNQSNLHFEAAGGKRPSTTVADDRTHAQGCREHEAAPPGSDFLCSQKVHCAHSSTGSGLTNHGCAATRARAAPCAPTSLEQGWAACCSPSSSKCQRASARVWADTTTPVWCSRSPSRVSVLSSEAHRLIGQISQPESANRAVECAKHGQCCNPHSRPAH
mgnify:CR=1 FL=1